MLALSKCFHKFYNNIVLLRRGLKTVDKLEENIGKIRNVGIIAHIDAGKTTTTERMLYYSGFTQSLGNVDDGNTVMDYMDQERERGITITSAAITFLWKQFQMNLIDTPGHVDFTIEVERALRVLDGAVAIFDASAGVEAQSLTVWRQAQRYNVPRIAYINKMDKSGADYYYSVKSIEKHLNTIAVPLQIPIGKEKTFTGVVDLLSMNKLTWNNEKAAADNGKSFLVEKLGESDESYALAMKYRIAMIEKMAQVDDKLAELLLDKYDLKYELVDDNILLDAHLRKLSLGSKVTPILCGSSFKNIAVQPLLDAIVKYLPSPEERKYPFQRYYGENFCALCFKTLHEHRKMNKKQLTESVIETGNDILTFVRVYNGELKAKSRIYNATKGIKEEIDKIFIPYAKQMKPVQSVKSGNIAVVSGLTKTTTGDTIVLNEKIFDKAIEKLNKEHVEADIQLLQAGLQVPPPVYFCSIEVTSQSEDNRLAFALKCLQREDPSLKVSLNDSETIGQTIIQGMGELHLEIIKERIKKEYGLEVFFGPLEIAYKETPTVEVRENLNFEKTINSRKNTVELELTLIPKRDHVFNSITIVRNEENQFAELTKEQIDAINHGIRSALSSGVLLNYPVNNVDVHMTKLNCSRNTITPILSTVSNQCIKNALKRAQCVIQQPVMRLEITTQNEYSAKVTQDLVKRNSFNLKSDSLNQITVISSKTPLAQLRTYSSDLRRITSGHTTFSIEFDSYEQITQKEYQELLDKIYK